MVPAEAQRDTFAIVGGTPSVSRREVQWTIVLRPMRGVQSVAQVGAFLIQAVAQFLVGRVAPMFVPICAHFGQQKVP